MTVVSVPPAYPVCSQGMSERLSAKLCRRSSPPQSPCLLGEHETYLASRTSTGTTGSRARHIRSAGEQPPATLWWCVEGERVSVRFLALLDSSTR